LTVDVDDRDPSSFGLDELARRSGVSRRTIRYYQSEHLLPATTKHGREAMYGEPHVERLALIADLRDQGLTLHTIRELVSTENPTRTVSRWLGVDATLQAPWSDDRPQVLTQTELVDVVGTRRGVIGDLQDAGFVRRRADGNWDVPSPAMLRQAVDLVAAGIDVDIAGKMRDLLRRRLAKAVDDTVKLIVERTGRGFAGAASPQEVATAVGALRPIAREMSGVILAQEVERALAELVRSRA
jgi:DNA-binding transcriptional MerR regulator